MRIFKNLSVQLSLIAIGIPTLVLTIFGIYHIQTQTASLENQLNDALKNEAVQLSASLSIALYNFDEEMIKVISRAVLKKPEIIKITIWDYKHKYLFFQDEQYMFKTTGKDDKIIRYPINFGRAKIGKIEIIATRFFLNKKIKTLMLNSILQIVVLDLILGLVLIVILNLRFVRPLQELQQGSEKITAGWLDQPINIHRDDELGALAKNLVIMRDAVKEKVESLQSEVLQHQKTKNYIDNIINSKPAIVNTIFDNRSIIFF